MPTALPTTLPLPAEGKVRSIANGLPVGLFPAHGLWRHRSPLTVCGTGRSVLTAGYRGSGVTNLMHTATAAALRTNDTVVMHIDDAGGLSTPWLRSNPASIERVAVDEAGTESMLSHCLAIVEHRKLNHPVATSEHLTSAWTPGDGVTACAECYEPHPPAILVLADEWAFEGLSWGKPSRAVELMHQLMIEGAKWGVYVIARFPQATAGHVSDDVRAAVQPLLMPGLPSYAASFLYGWTRKPVADPQLGQALALNPRDELEPAGIYYTSPKMAFDVARATAGNRPVLSGREFELGGDDFEQRWSHPALRKRLDQMAGSTTLGSKGDR